jgi:hypothetical protein
LSRVPARASTTVVDDFKPKRFEDIPGPMVLPGIGTMWEALPFFGED